MGPISRAFSGPERLIVALALLAFPCGCATRTSGPAGAPRGGLPLVRSERTAHGAFEGDFAAVLDQADPSQRFVTLVDLTDNLDLRAFDRGLRKARAGKSARREGILQALERVAHDQQALLRPLLDRLQADGSVGYVRPVAIVNRVVVEGTPAGIRALAASREIALIRPDWTSQRPRGQVSQEPVTVPVPLGETFRSWAVDTTGAASLWAEGLDGAGVVVGAIDTGAFEAHEQLRGKALPGERGWFDPVEGTTTASDSHGHGTEVLSQAVGANPSERVVGMAPKARWCAALGNWRNYYSRSRMTLAADWMLRVGRPDVLVNAWSHDEGLCSDFDRAFIDAWKASGIFVVFPAGNSGPAAGSGEAPAQLAGIFPAGGPVFSVAALAPSGLPLAISSRGPSRCGSTGFPTLAGPGADLPMAAPGSPRGYVRGEGTSLTAGVVAGAAALLLQAVPEADPDEVERALVEGARDVPPSGWDLVSGAGALDVPAALARLRGARSR